MNIGVNLNSPASLALALWSFDARRWSGSLAVQVLDGIFLQYKTVASPLEICCSVLLFSPQGALDSWWPCGLQHARLPCPSLSPGVYSDSCPMSQWCHLNISSSAALFSFCHRSFPALGSFPMSQLFASGDQSIGASASFLPMNIQGWFPLGLTGLVSLLFKGLSRVFSTTIVWKHQFFGIQPSLWSTSHICTRILEKPKV